MLDVDGVDFFTAILDRKTGDFVCWYYTPDGAELVRNLDLNNQKYTLADFKPHEIVERGLPQPEDYKAPVPECEIPPYTDEQVMILNMQKGIEDLLDAIVALPKQGTILLGPEWGYPTISHASAVELVRKFKKDFDDGKIA
jgi:hypothetical protein